MIRFNRGRISFTLEEKVVKKLKQQAGAHGVSMEEEHRRILREALLGKTGKRPSFKEYLRQLVPFGLAVPGQLRPPQGLD